MKARRITSAHQGARPRLKKTLKNICDERFTPEKEENKKIKKKYPPFPPVGGMYRGGT
jgi:hypothetical protein